MAHGQWTEVEARGVLDAWKKSGLGLGEFARSRGSVPQRLRWWKKKLAPDLGKVIALLPAHVVEPRRGEPVTELLRSGHVVKVGREFDQVAFARVVAVLEGG
ncbi:MAG: hypothetical protein FJ137_00140 [Deltaproteobacteria bacterium]|nr:hypothetical protein [Deltaproteobacteria bacterium]